jgi:acylphosphatase
MPCWRCLVSGRVQGVFFRAGTREQAQRLGIKGWARNLPGGQVEVMACGGEAELRALRDWLWQGPPWAHVTSVHCVDVEEREFLDFTAR